MHKLKSQFKFIKLPAFPTTPSHVRQLSADVSQVAHPMKQGSQVLNISFLKNLGSQVG
jgi:hypothetical protein